MGFLQDLLKEVPLSAVLKERVALAEQKYAGAIEENAALKLRVQTLEEENGTLRSQLPKKKENVDKDTARVLAYFFRAEGDTRDVGIASRSLQMEKGILKYHLDLLEDAGYAKCTGGNYVHGHVYWALTPQGRRFAVEQKLI